MSNYFYSYQESRVIMWPMLLWLHENVDENKRGKPYDWDWHSDGSCQTGYVSKNYKWKINSEHGSTMK